jgi:4-amino-4-deoxy-L-arabinose transferase-like glycosyltransferase
VRAGSTLGDQLTEELTATPDRGPSRVDVLRTAATPARAVLAGILALAIFLDVVELNTEGYANTYYAAAVKSMAMNWHNFFFAAFDPGAFVAVDNRNNTSDSVLILLLLLAGLAVTRAAEDGRLRWLLTGGVVVGLAFNVKEIEALRGGRS